MKEITRIHIAKTPYDIELSAKKELEKYIKSLSLYADDPEVMSDVEVRITELLAERGILKDNVITHEDIEAIRAQLGEPHDFADENNDIAIGTDTEALVETPHRLYRDTDTPVLGGVLSGIAKYFGINPLWIRLGFLLLCIPSIGTLFLAYIILWLVVPPARSAAEKLQLEGKPITLASIKELSIQEASAINTRPTSAIFQKVLLYGIGVIALVHALCALIVTVWGGILLGMPDNLLSSYTTNPLSGWAAYILFVLSGLLLTALFSLITYALFSRRWSKRIGVAIVAIIVSGILSFSSAIGTMLYSEWQKNNEISDSRFTKKVYFADDFKHASQLDITSQSNADARHTNVYVQYIVTNEKPYYELTLDATTKDVVPLVSYSEGSAAKITIAPKSSANTQSSYASFSMTIYGPSLETISLDKENLNVDYSNKNAQERIAINNTAGSFNLSGSYKTVNATNSVDAQTTLDDATIEILQANMLSGRLSAGVVRTLNIQQSDICPSSHEGTKDNRLVVRGISSNQLTYNGAERPAKTVSQACGDTIIGSESDFDALTEKGSTL